MSRASTYALLSVFEDTLRMRAEVPLPVAIEFLRTLGGYNELIGSDVGEMLLEIDRIIPRAKFADVSGHPNPNNGKRTYTLEVGREGSPVLYIRRYLHTGDSPLSEGDVQAIEQFARVAKADEVSYELEIENETQKRFNGREWSEIVTVSPPQPGMPFEVAREEFRFWWD
ncbi:MAG: hypothetical protein WC798_02870 [Candidatus Paceibacterota bacterium]|jgi:hypothetical protein